MHDEGPAYFFTAVRRFLLASCTMDSTMLNCSLSSTLTRSKPTRRLVEAYENIGAQVDCGQRGKSYSNNCCCSRQSEHNTRSLK
ncbi:hypothetical protein TNIN_206461 [Trichonephila inaurata madagascariensis]|uniref:Uncharacterized protein n=1 Tax=Trichonephila inaurata madagascariensis TaxID=2747483 RepID=A0A8X6XYJ2_9ARAC|nr:hypothetical protein TNIN_206461 [Trichonephila inaurata madagascariensis]